MRNNLAPVISGMIGQMILAIVIGSVYYNLEPTTASFDKRAILLYFGLMLNAFSPAFEVILPTISSSRAATSEAPISHLTIVLNKVQSDLQYSRSTPDHRETGPLCTLPPGYRRLRRIPLGAP